MTDELLYCSRPVESSWTITKFSDPVGYWILDPGGTAYTKFAMYNRPTDEQIKNTEELLGWKWQTHE